MLPTAPENDNPVISAQTKEIAHRSQDGHSSQTKQPSLCVQIVSSAGPAKEAFGVGGARSWYATRCAWCPQKLTEGEAAEAIGRVP